MRWAWPCPAGTGPWLKLPSPPPCVRLPRITGCTRRGPGLRKHRCTSCQAPPLPALPGNREFKCRPRPLHPSSSSHDIRALRNWPQGQAEGPPSG
ncbi:hypothetical protein NDU88_006491 [Pleurodeles waltl]|uniref:Uncharacterized protein n=1 Tax=Pleurodeles waltl TaxID=8319 RepID=A0AAV7L7M5_PLEWA|nr:hypothetical protein NDU88_006491 [Pleurodeles waltl]